MPGHNIIVVGTSAGGIEALSQLVHGLPAGLPAALFVVCHFPAGGTSHLPDILSRHGALLAAHARDGDPIYPGQICVAPPGRHLVLEEGTVRLLSGPRENHMRPAIDPLFRSAARIFGPCVVAVVLSGSLHDGVAGLLAVRAAGGLSVVQDPEDALVPALPRVALEIAGADYVRSAAKLAPLLVDLIHRPALTKRITTMTEPLEKMKEVVTADADAQVRNDLRGRRSFFTCPECGGSLWQVDEQKLVRFRCHVGHVYEGEALLAEQTEALEAALWTAVRTFKDKAVLARQLSGKARENGRADSAERFEDEARLAERYSGLIQQYLSQGTDFGAAPGG